MAAGRRCVRDARASREPGGVTRAPRPLYSDLVGLTSIRSGKRFSVHLAWDIGLAKYSHKLFSKNYAILSISLLPGGERGLHHMFSDVFLPCLPSSENVLYRC